MFSILKLLYSIYLWAKTNLIVVSRDTSIFYVKTHTAPRPNNFSTFPNNMTQTFNKISKDFKILHLIVFNASLESKTGYPKLGYIDREEMKLFLPLNNCIQNLAVSSYNALTESLLLQSCQKKQRLVGTRRRTL